MTNRQRAYKSTVSVLRPCKIFKSINCIEFQQKLFELRRWLHVQYDIESHDIIANCSSNSIEKANQRLHFTDVTKNKTCAKHQNTQCTLYCPNHDTFFCTACRVSIHGTCHGIKQLMSSVEQKRRLAIKSLKGNYNVRIENALFNRDNTHQAGWEIITMCMLPNGEALLADFENQRLKNLNSSYKVISYCDLTENPYTVCYKGNDTAVAGLKGNSIQYVNSSGNIKLKQLVKLDHECFGLACHGDKLYINSEDTIYKYDNNCEQKHVLYQYRENLRMFYIPSIAINENGERLYFIANTGLTTIDAKGTHIFSTQFDDYSLLDICIASEGIVLVLDATHNVHQVDSNGNEMNETVNNMPLSLSILRSMYFDRERCRRIVGDDKDMIYVYKCELLPT